MESIRSMYSDFLQAMYEPVHGYLAVTVCLLGTIFNIMNILVLTHKDMRSNPINLLLTGIAVADMMVMVEYIPFAFHMYLLQGKYRTIEEKVCSCASFSNFKVLQLVI